MEQFNFEGVEAATGINYTQPGTVGLFKIGKVEFGNSQEKQTAYMKLTYEAKKVRNEEGALVDEQSSFQHSYYMTPAALKRVQYLALVIFGEEFKEKMTDAQLTAKFLNKDVGLKVVGQVSNKGKGYPDLGYAGYAMKASEFLSDPSKLQFSSGEKSLIADALEAIKASRSSNADTESAGGVSAPAPAPGKKPF